MAAVTNNATSYCDRSGTYSICKEEDDRIEYTCIIPDRPWKKKKRKIPVPTGATMVCLWHRSIHAAALSSPLHKPQINY